MTRLRLSLSALYCQELPTVALMGTLLPLTGLKLECMPSITHSGGGPSVAGPLFNSLRPRKDILQFQG